jgi:hypothetical protein
MIIRRLSIIGVVVVLAACLAGGSTAGSATLASAPSPAMTTSGTPSAPPASAPIAATPSSTPQASSPASETCATSVATAGLTSGPLNRLSSVRITSLRGYDRVAFSAGSAWGGIQITPAIAPFRTTGGTVTSVAGDFFYQITLNRVDARAVPAAELDQLVSGSLVRELVKISETAAGEAWIVGLAGPACIDVGWLRTPTGETFNVDFASPLVLTPVSGSSCLTSGWSGPVGPGTTVPPLASVRDVQIGSSSVDVRLSSLGGISVRFSQVSPPFARDPSGLPVEVGGSSFWKVVLSGVDGSGLPTAELDQARSGVIVEALREIGDSEGVETWIIGYTGSASGICGRVYVDAEQNTIEFRLAPAEGS